MSALTAFATAESTFFDLVAGHAERNPDQPALVALGFAPISYRDLLIQTGKIWDCLRDAGIKYGSQIGIALQSGPESAIATIAIAANPTCLPFNHVIRDCIQRDRRAYCRQRFGGLGKGASS